MAIIERQSGNKIMTLRTNNGTEYVNHELRRFLEQKGIRHFTTVPYTPEQNGIAKRQNRTIIGKDRSMLCDAKLDHRFWAEAIRNMTPGEVDR